MKKLILLVVTLIGAYGTLLSQVTFGIKVGASQLIRANNKENYDSDNNSYSHSAKGTFGLDISGYAHYSINHIVGIQGEIGYMRFANSSNTFYIPLLAKIKLGNRAPFSVIVGPQLELSNGYTYPNISTPDYGHFTPDLAGVAGIRYQGGKHLFFDVRYSFGFTELISLNGTNEEAHNQIVQVGIGWMF